MATPRHRYTLVGFSDELDWRTLNFVDPIPPNIICKACGLVTRVTAFLPCLHVFCKKCYEQCRDDEEHCCPLDGQRALEEEVQWMEFPVGNLLKRKVKCWNEDRGCDIVLPASELKKHFCKDCDHHSSSCPRYSMVVRCNNVCAHLQSECRDHVMCAASGNPQSNITGEKALMMALNTNKDTRVGKMKERLDHNTHENNAQINRLNEISHCMNTVKETLLEIPNRTSALGSFASSSEAIHETLNDHSEKLQQFAGTISNSHETLKEGMERSLERLKENTASSLKAEEMLALSRINVKRHEFVVEGFTAMKERASSTGYSAYWAEKKYICGYHMSPGVQFWKEARGVYLRPQIQLHKGVIDDVLQWPFKEKVRLTIKHPSQNKECRKEGVANGYPMFYARPDKGSNPEKCFWNAAFLLDYLEREGYVADDKLRVVLELVSEK